MSGFDCKETRFGFEWGPADVQRVFSHPKWGVIIQVETKYERIELRITPKGFIRTGRIVKKEKQ